MHKIDAYSWAQYQALNHNDRQAHPMTEYRPYRHGPVFIKFLAYASVAVVPLILAIWLPLDWEDLRYVDFFEGSPIGGTLTLTQAKAIDFVSSAIIAPLLLVVLNYVWFSVARASIINERKQNASGISLYALLEASNTASGSHDLFKFWTLFTSRSSRLMVFAFITLFAAFARSLFSNVIAYEAFNVARDAADVRLRLLNGFHMTSGGIVQDSNATTAGGNLIYWPTSDEQEKQFTMQTTSVMQQVVWQNSTTYLNGSAYIAANITQADLNNVPSLDVVLQNVPAVKGTIDCKPYSPKAVRYNIPAVNAGYSGLRMDVYFFDNAANVSINDASYAVSIPSDTSALADGSSASYTRSTDFLAYDQYNATSIFIGRMAQNIGLTEEWIANNSDPIHTYYGTLQPLASNFTTNANGSCDDTGTIGAWCKYLVWGLSCSITQEQGQLTLSRSAVNDPWKMSDESWDEKTKIIRPSSLAGLSQTLGKIEYQPMKYGVGPALTPTARTCKQKGDGSEGCTPYGPKNFNYETWSHNLLWAEMEIQRVTYEIGALNSSVTDSSMYRTVGALGDVQFYRMTYVPALLFAALLSIFLTASLTAFLSVYSRRTIGHQNFRVYDSLRLLVDCVASPGVVGSIPREDAIVAPNDVLEGWAKGLNVRHDAYRVEKNVVGDISGVVLVPADFR